MAQFQIHENLNEGSNKNYPFLLNVQSQLLETLDTRLVIPLSDRIIPKDKRIKELNPIIKIGKKEYYLITQQMAAIPKRQLGPEVTNVANLRQDILNSIDFLITGF